MVDAKGRIIMPENLTAAAGLTETAVFVGVGNKFEIWEPERYVEHAAKQKARLH